jgi:endoglucanase
VEQKAKAYRLDCAEWGRQYHRPLHLGEFGAITSADVETRARWTGLVRQTAEKDGMNFAAWAFSRAGFDVFDEKTGRRIEPVKEALSPKK